MSNPQEVTIVRSTAESNNEVDALAQARAQAEAPVTTQEHPPAEKPQWLPQKFNSPEELAKAYGELEKKIGSGGIDMGGLEKYSQEFAQTGDISAESVKAIAAMGIPEPLIRAYVDGQKSITEANVGSVMSMVGGEQRYSAMVDWASGAMDESEVSAFNKIMDSGDVSAIRMAVQGLKARYEQANGVAGRLIQGETTGPSGGAYRSVAEIVAAMKDPRYAKDPAYRKDVEQRVALSNALGVNR